MEWSSRPEALQSISNAEVSKIELIKGLIDLDRAFSRLDGPTSNFCMHFYADFTHVLVVFIIADAYLDDELSKKHKNNWNLCQVQLSKNLQEIELEKFEKFELPANYFSI